MKIKKFCADRQEEMEMVANYSLRIPVETKDEIGKLSAGIKNKKAIEQSMFSMVQQVES